MCYGGLHALLSYILCQYFVNLSLFAKTDQKDIIFLQRVLFVDNIRKLPPFVKSVEFQLATIVAVIFQEFLLWPLVLQILKSTNRICLSLLLFWIFRHACSSGSLNCLNQNFLNHFLSLFRQILNFSWVFCSLRSLWLRKNLLRGRCLYLWLRRLLSGRLCYDNFLLLLLVLWLWSLTVSLVNLKWVRKSSCLLVSILLSQLSLCSSLFLFINKSLAATLLLLLKKLWRPWLSHNVRCRITGLSTLRSWLLTVCRIWIRSLSHRFRRFFHIFTKYVHSDLQIDNITTILLVWVLFIAIWLGTLQMLLFTIILWTNNCALNLVILMRIEVCRSYIWP